MVMTVNQIGDQPFVPGSVGFLYVSDQLVAGDQKIVTEGQATITGGLSLPRGTIMGKVTVGAIAQAFVGTGNGVLSALVAGLNTKTGAYTLTAIDATHFAVADPLGHALPNLTTGVAYANAELNALITVGGTPFVAGDKFTVTVAAGSNSWKKAIATAVDGSQNPAGMLLDASDASGGDVNGAIGLTGEYNANYVFFDPSFTLQQVRDALRQYTIFLKSSVSAAPPT